MNYFQAKSDLKFMQEFQGLVFQLWELEKQAINNLSNDIKEQIAIEKPMPNELQTLIQREAFKIKDYQFIRDQVTKKLLRANRIANNLEVPIIFEDYPMPALAGRAPIIRISCFDAVLRDNSYQGVTQHFIYDALNQTIGECETQIEKEFWHLINPFYWVKELLVFIIRIPFMLINASGFDTSKVEDQFLAKAFKLAEIIVIIYILIRLGITTTEIKQLLINILPR